MKLYLDDTRMRPDNTWILVQTPNELLQFLNFYGNDITEISLDYDLGDDEKIGTGYDVLTWIENAVVMKSYIPPKIHIHTSNPSARIKMLQAVKQIQKLYNKKKGD